MGSLQRWPALRGGLLAVVAAALFGISTPLVQRSGSGVGPFTTAALLYAGAALLGAALRRDAEREAKVRAGDLPRLVAMAAFGAVVGPVALAWGLQHTSGTSASLMLALEALFTAVLAHFLYRESMDGRVWFAMLLLLTGGVLLVVDPEHCRARAVHGAAGRSRRHGSLGHRQHALAKRRGTGPGAGGTCEGIAWGAGGASPWLDAR